MRKDQQFLRELQRYVAITTVGPSALRNQGTTGVIQAAQDHLSSLNLHTVRTASETAFLRWLDQETEQLRRALPKGAQNWGAARKALNLFLRDVCYNRFLCRGNRIAALLKRWSQEMGDNRDLPRWPGLIKLTPDTSRRFQNVARKLARSQGISRVHLDMRLWTTERKKAVSKRLRAAAL
jgi:hypothetical protein